MSIAERAKEIARIPGLKWQELISILVREFHVPVNVAAKYLDPWYTSAREATELLTENYSGMIDPQIRDFLEKMAAFPADLEAKVEHISKELGISKPIAAELLYPYLTRK